MPLESRFELESPRNNAVYLIYDPGVKPGDVFISLVPVAPEDWSFGNGKAQYVKTDPP
jgi:hypothetical protein